MNNPFPKRITVNVTKNHIANGKAGMCRSCPIALAVIDRLKLDYSIEIKVHEDWLTIKYPYRPSPFIYNLSKKFKNFVRRFDDDRIVKPIKSHITFDFAAS